MKALIAVALALGVIFPAAAPRVHRSSAIVCSRATVPSVIGMSGEDARSTLTTSGFTNLRLAFDKSGPYDLQRAHYQNPTGGSTAFRCNEVFVAFSE